MRATAVARRNEAVLWVRHQALSAVWMLGLTLMPAAALSQASKTNAGVTPVGAELYVAACARCHGTSLAGGTAPALRGPAFAQKWGELKPSALGAYIQQTMPPDSLKRLEPAAAQALAEFVLATSATLNGKVSAGGDDKAFAAASDEYSLAAAARLKAVASRLTPVTDAMLKAPPKDDWLVWRGGLEAQGYSRLTQITAENAGQLRLVWSKTLGPGTNGIAPLAHDGVIFVHGGGKIWALDAASGDTVWSVEDTAPPGGVRQPRGIALYGDAVYASTVNNHTYALDAKTGNVLWEHVSADKNGNQEGTFTAAPLVVKGRVFQGAAQCAHLSARCYMVALDAATGAELWRTYTIPGDGEVGSDSWGGAPAKDRGGAGIWVAPSYDFARDQVLFGTGNSYALRTLLRRDPRNPEPALYTNTTLKLDAKTGKVVWHFQHIAGDVWDMDWSFERMLLDDPRGSHRPIVINMAKSGILDALDLESGRYLWSIDLGYQDIVTRINPKTGEKTVNKAKIPFGKEIVDACPFADGVRNWPATSFDPERGLLFVPMQLDTCMQWRVDPANPVQFTSMVKPKDGSKHLYGGWAGIDLKSGKTVWLDQRRAPQASAMLATAGGVVFEGGRDRWFRARESATGKVLWQTRMSDTPNSFPITYTANGHQYVAVVTGGQTYHDAVLAHLTPDIEPSVGRMTLSVFALEPAEAAQ